MRFFPTRSVDIEDIFFHIPLDVIRNGSTRSKVFWFLCLSSCALYAAYTSFGIVYEYFSQPLVTVSENDQLETLPRLEVSILALWDYHKLSQENISNDVTFFYNATVPLYTLQNGLRQTNSSTSYKPIFPRDYIEATDRLLGRASIEMTLEDMYDRHIGVNKRIVPLDIALEMSSLIPRYTYFALQNMPFHGEVARSSIHANVSCNWTGSFYSQKPEILQLQIIIPDVEASGVHVVTFSPKSVRKQRRFLRLSKSIRIQNCGKRGKASSKLKCTFHQLLKHLNCCYCSEFLFECYTSWTRCCVREEILSVDLVRRQDIFRPCFVGKLDSKRPCVTRHATWSEEAVVSFAKTTDLQRSHFCSESDDYFDRDIEIDWNTERTRYREEYRVTLSHVFCTIGGVLGFFLGGSIISVMQCGVFMTRTIARAVIACRAGGTRAEAEKRRNKESS